MNLMQYSKWSEVRGEREIAKETLRKKQPDLEDFRKFSACPRYTFIRNETIDPHVSLYINSHSSVIQNSPKVVTTQIFINW